jgi:hypothetical protein
MSETMKVKLAEHAVCVLEHRCPTPRPSSTASVPCVDGMAGECRRGGAATAHHRALICCLESPWVTVDGGRECWHCRRQGLACGA